MPYVIAISGANKVLLRALGKLVKRFHATHVYGSFFVLTVPWESLVKPTDRIAVQLHIVVQIYAEIENENDLICLSVVNQN